MTSTGRWLGGLILVQFVQFAIAVEVESVANDDLWLAGVATRKITPADPMWMAGYASRNRPSEGIAQDLFVKALALQAADGRRVVIVTCDLISVPRPLRDALEKQLLAAFDLPAASLMINCSHTHCGPEIRISRWSLDGLPPERLEPARRYATFLQESLFEVVRSALSDLQPATLAYCHARCGFAMNRRTLSMSGFRNFPNPDGPVDHDVPVLRVDSPTGELRAVLFGYACHNTTLSFYQFCGDYAGYAQQYLQENHPSATALFVAGCGGDQNPYPRRTLAHAEQHGRALANSVETAIETEKKILKGVLQCAYGMATVEYQTPPSREQLLRRSQSDDKVERLHASRLLIQLDTEGELLYEYDCPIQTIRLGEYLTLIALPGETVVDYSIRLKQELAGDPQHAAVWVAGYSNDVFAYIPSRRVLLEGGYEAGDAMRHMTTVLQPGPFAPNVEERIIGKVHSLLAESLSQNVFQPPTQSAAEQ